MIRYALILLVMLICSPASSALPSTHGQGSKEPRHQASRKLIARKPGAIESAGGHYKAVGVLEDKVNIALGVAGGLVALVSAGVAGMSLTEHLACKNVARQEETMQKSWDSMHPDGFTPAGDQMRPATFDCSAQERRLKPLKSYAGAPSWY